MDEIATIDCFSVLAQETRLAAFQLLVRHEPDGLPAGHAASHLNVPHNTMSAHLAVLVRTHLVVSHRESRSIIYRANLSQLQETVWFMVRDALLDSSAGCSTRPDA